MRDGLNERAVVGEQNQPLAVGIEPPGGDQSDARNVHQLDHGLVGVSIRDGAHHAKWFVQRDVPATRRLWQRGSVHPDVVGGNIDFHAGRFDRLAIHAHPALGDERLGLTPRRDARVGQGFL